MEKDRQTKIIAIVALFIGVATLTLGFAAFSTKLIIQSKATIKPDADSFKVLLSKEQNSVVVGSVIPIGNGGEAIINNDNVPTISGLKAKFVNLGEKVVYEFYAVNTGDLDAFLNKIEFTNVSGKTANKVCTAGTGTTDAYVQSACNSIRVTVKVGEDDKACQTSTYSVHKLEKKNGEKVVVTIEYNEEGVRADGPFEVQFGDITLNYSTVDMETKNVPTCDEFVSRPVYGLAIQDRTNIEDNDNDGKIGKSDKVTLGTESFYVISTDETTNSVTMLAEWNLNVGNNTVSGTVGMQNEACKGWVSGSSTYHCTIAFSNINYWNSSVSIYPAYVYNNNSYLYTHVVNYVNKLRKLGYNNISGRLIKHEELVSLGCPASTGYCSSVSWVKNASFWSGSAVNSTYLWRLNTDGYLHNAADNYSFSRDNGVRPVITINASEI